MTKTYIRTVKIAKWFPPNDKLAACIARLCVLREDFLLESNGILARAIPELDGVFEQYRGFYFFRNNLRTLFEIKSALQTVQQNSEFKRMLARQSPADRTEFQRLMRDFNKSHTLLKDLRNAIGGHVLQANVEAALNDTDLNRFGTIEVGPKLKDLRYKFAAEILVAIVVAGIPDKQQAAKVEKDFTTIRMLLPALSIVDKVIAMYAGARKLI